MDESWKLQPQSCAVSEIGGRVMMANDLNATVILNHAIPVVENKTRRFPSRLKSDRSRHVTIVVARQRHHLATLS